MSLRRFALPVLIWSIAISSAAAAATTDSSISSIPNFHQVDPRVFRGGQPLDSAWPDLAKLGVKTVIDLRQVSEHSTTAEAQAVKAAGMHYVNSPWDGFQTPRGEQIARVLQARLEARPFAFHVTCYLARQLKRLLLAGSGGRLAIGDPGRQ